MSQRLNGALWRQLRDRSAREHLTLQAQIREMLVAAILDGHLAPGVPIPSSRDMADQLGVARNTVVLAYHQLCDEGYLQSRQRSGHFVNVEMLAGRLQPPAQPSAPGPGRHAPDWSRRLQLQPSAQRSIVKPRRLAGLPLPLPVRPVRRLVVPHRRLARGVHEDAQRARHPRMGA